MLITRVILLFGLIGSWAGAAQTQVAEAPQVTAYRGAALLDIAGGELRNVELTVKRGREYWRRDYDGVNAAADL